MSKSVLVIDDDPYVRKSFQLALEDTGYGVETAENGHTGVERFRSLRPDMVFLDLKMPGLNGVETLTELRRLDARVPVYIVTAFHREFLDQLRAAARQGLDFELLQKPVDMDRILDLTRNILEAQP